MVKTFLLKLTYHVVLTVTRNTFITPKWLDLTSNDAVQIAASLLLASVHLHVTGGFDRSQKLTLQSKGEAIRQVKNRLRTVTRTSNDAAIRAVTCLLLFEVCLTKRVDILY
jgi:hypothetical protein